MPTSWKIEVSMESVRCSTDEEERVDTGPTEEVEEDT
jgi:hypothetical protein